jgi:hypothetical protein
VHRNSISLSVFLTTSLPLPHTSESKREQDRESEREHTIKRHGETEKGILAKH